MASEKVADMEAQESSPLERALVEAAIDLADDAWRRGFVAGASWRGDPPSPDELQEEWERLELRRP